MPPASDVLLLEESINPLYGSDWGEPRLKLQGGDAAESLTPPQHSCTGQPLQWPLHDKGHTAMHKGQHSVSGARKGAPKTLNRVVEVWRKPKMAYTSFPNLTVGKPKR